MFRYVLSGCMLMVLLSGCAKTYQNPTLNVITVTDPRVEVVGSGAAVQVRLSNPNPVPLTLEGLQLKVLSGRAIIAEGMVPVEGTLAAFSTRDMRVPVTVSNLGVLRAALRLTKEKRVNGTVQAHIHFLGPNGKSRRARINHADAFDLKALTP